MATITEHNKDTGYMEFAINDASEIDLLPTMTQWGKGSLSRVEPVIEGSLAMEPDFTMHRLTPGGWVLV